MEFSIHIKLTRAPKPKTLRERVAEAVEGANLTPFSFRECDTCRAKPGTPILCEGCLNNRSELARAAYLVSR